MSQKIRSKHKKIIQTILDSAYELGYQKRIKEQIMAQQTYNEPNPETY